MKNNNVKSTTLARSVVGGAGTAAMPGEATVCSGHRFLFRIQLGHDPPFRLQDLTGFNSSVNCSCQAKSDVTKYRYGDHLEDALKHIFQYGQGVGIPRTSAPVLQLIH